MLSFEAVRALLPSAAKLRQDEDTSVISTLFGVPVGFQFGTAMGFKGLPGLAIDILTDPLNLVAFPIGALTKTGKAARVVGRLAKGAAVAAEVAPEVTKAAQLGVAALKTGAVDEASKTLQALRILKKSVGLTTEQKLAETSLLIHRKAALETAPFQQLLDDIAGKSEEEVGKHLQSLKSVAGSRKSFSHLIGEPGVFHPNIHYVNAASTILERDGVGAVRSYLSGQIAKRGTLQSEALRLAKAGNFSEFQTVVKEIEKLHPSKGFDILFKNRRKEWRAFFEVGESGQPIQMLADNLADQTARGQRALLQAGIPFTSVQKPLIQGTGAMAGAAAAGAMLKPITKYLPESPTGMVPGAQASSARYRKLAGDPTTDFIGAHTVYDVTKRAVDSIRGIDIPKNERQFGNVADTLFIEKDRTSTFAKTAGMALKAAMTDAGLVSEKDMHLLTEALQNKEAFFKIERYEEPLFRDHVGSIADKVPVGPEGKLIRKAGRFGPTRVYGGLTDHAIKAGLTEKHARLIEALDTAIGDAGQVAISEGAIRGSIDDYFPRLVKKVTKGKEEAARLALIGVRDGYTGSGGKITTKSFTRHAMQRTIPGYEQLLELEKRGLIEVEKDPSVVISAYLESVGKAAANARFSRRLKGAMIPAELTEQASKVAGDGMVPALVPDHLTGPKKAYVKALQQSGMYERISSDWALNYAEEYIRHADDKMFKRLKKTQLGEDAAFRFEKIGRPNGIWIRKDLVRPLRAVVESGISVKPAADQLVSDKAFAAALAMNSVMKRSLLSFSAFHYMALTESAIASQGASFFRNIPTYAQMFKEGGNPLNQRHFLESLDIYDDALKAGLELNPPMDAEMDTFNRAIKWTADRVGAPKAAKAIIAADAAINGRLWYYHRGLKFHAFNELRAKALLHYQDEIQSGAKKVSDITKGVADHVNTSFGGNSFDRFLVSKKGQQWMRLLMLAPDWTVSNMLIAKDVFANWFLKNEIVKKTGKWWGLPVSDAMIAQHDVRQFFARQYAMRSGLYLAGAAAMANYAFTGHFPWDNSDKHKTHLELPWKDSQGRALYLDSGKQFTEPFEMLAGPIEGLNKKSAPLMRLAITQLTGRDFFGRPIVTAEDGPLANVAKRIGVGVNSLAPITAQEILGMRSAGDKDLSTRLLNLTGMPVKVEFKRKMAQEEDAAAEDPQPVIHATEPEEAELSQGFGLYGEAMDSYRKDYNYMRGLESSMAVLPRGLNLPVAR